jgi:hypothetical protein
MFIALPSPDQSIDKGGVKSVGIGISSTRKPPKSSMGAMRGISKMWEDSKERTICYRAGDGSAGRLAGTAEEGHGYSDMFSL